MKLIIDIPKERLDSIKHFGIKQNEVSMLERALISGTPLSKGHGRLIDADAYRKEMLDSREFDFFKRLDIQPTIIEADKEDE